MRAQPFIKLLLSVGALLTTFGAGIFAARFVPTDQPISLVNPFVTDPSPSPKPLLAYTIPNLQRYPYQPSKMNIERTQNQNDEFVSYVFSYTTMGKKMTGQLNVPISVQQAPQTHEPLKTIVLLRGYVPPDIFDSGVGTKNAAAVFARNGYLTIAPDFFGYGNSDPEFVDSWQARFAKPVQVIELIRSIRVNGIPLTADIDTQVSATVSGIWAHSNGGQIALTSLEVLGEAIPTTLWAPVTAPFPYSILFFGDEELDEGKAQRAWIAQFERDYDVFDFSLTQHIHQLQGPLQIHHGTVDDAALYARSAEFIEKLRSENKRREQVQKNATALAATASGQPNISPAVGSQAVESQPVGSQIEPSLAPISFQLFTYPGANHNLQPAENWNQAITRDLQLFEEQSN